MAYPQFLIKQLRLNEQGQNNDVLIVNEEWIFRFPKFVQEIQTLKHESALLTRLQPHITVAIPNPIYQQLSTEQIGQVFMGYKLLPGEPLWMKNFQRIQEPAHLEKLAHQLAYFLRQLHTLPHTLFDDLDLPIADQVAEWKALYAKIQTKLFPHMHDDGRRHTQMHFETYFSSSTRHCFEPTLRHGDFGTGNLLYDPATHNLTGIIDFGAATLGDPAIDFAGLLNFGDEFAKYFYSVYPEIETMQERVCFYHGTFALQEALYGIENNDQNAFISGMIGYC